MAYDNMYTFTYFFEIWLFSSYQCTIGVFCNNMNLIFCCIWCIIIHLTNPLLMEIYFQFCTTKGYLEINNYIILCLFAGTMPKVELLNQSLYIFKTLIHVVFWKGWFDTIILFYYLLLLLLFSPMDIFVNLIVMTIISLFQFTVITS